MFRGWDRPDQERGGERMVDENGRDKCLLIGYLDIVND